VDDSQEKIVLAVRAATVDEVLPFIERAAQFNTGSRAFDARLIAEQGLRFVFERDGVAVGGYVIELRGNEVFVMAAGGAIDCDFTMVGLNAIEQQAAAAGLTSVGFDTRRPALVKKALKRGYEIVGWKLRKKSR
jgi:hypothetical protein